MAPTAKLYGETRVQPIRQVVILTPHCKEPKDMVRSMFIETYKQTHGNPLCQGIKFSHCLLNDGAGYTLDPEREIISHELSQGLATTRVEGYRQALLQFPHADTYASVDSQEHPPPMVPVALDNMEKTGSRIIYLPVAYTVEKELRHKNIFIHDRLTAFNKALLLEKDSDPDTLMSIYNQIVAIGFLVFRRKELEFIVGYLERALVLYETIYKRKATWGFDFLTLLLAKKFFPDDIDSIFAGFMAPWKENRSFEKSEEQMRRVKEMLTLFRYPAFI